MTTYRIAQILQAHSIAVRFGVGGRVFARDQYAQGGQAMARWVDVTGWTASKLLAWLGY